MEQSTLREEQKKYPHNWEEVPNCEIPTKPAIVALVVVASLLVGSFVIIVILGWLATRQ